MKVAVGIYRIIMTAYKYEMKIKSGSLVPICKSTIFF